jgi:hypothetical protein
MQNAQEKERERERERERAKSVRLFGDDVKKFSFVHVSPIHQRKSDQNASSSSDNALGFIPHMHYTASGRVPLWNELLLHVVPLCT